MSRTDTSRNLELLDISPSTGGCGCGGCGSAETAGEAPASATTVTTAGRDTATVNESYSVTGMTCGHCASAVTSELRALDGVIDVQVDLVAGGTSTVTVTSDRPLADAQIAAALDEAGGYQLA